MENVESLKKEERKSLLKRYRASKKSRFRKWSRQEKMILTTTTVLFALYALTLIYPFLYTMLNALKTPDEFYESSLSLPQTFNWENFKKAFEIEYNGITFGDMIWNSVWQTLLSTGCGLAASAVMAYVTAKYDFKFLKVLYAVGIFSMVIPIIGSTPAMYKLLYDIGIADNPAFIWVIWLSGFGFAFLVLHSYFKTVSWTYAEAAFMDGAGHFTVFIKIMIPQALPAISSMIIVQAISHWNEYMTAYMYLPSYPNLALGLYELKSNFYYIEGGMPVYYALMLLSLIPVIIAFIVFQKAIMNNISTGGLKG